MPFCHKYFLAVAREIGASTGPETGHSAVAPDPDDTGRVIAPGGTDR
ncbi:hypothetical protein ACFQL1_02810 [Halomicroarcula sp. GCM10025709]|nr:hypothetical protein [Halomicroarcula sp. YJ-61-S]